MPFLQRHEQTTANGRQAIPKPPEQITTAGIVLQEAALPARQSRAARRRQRRKSALLQAEAQLSADSEVDEELQGYASQAPQAAPVQDQGGGEHHMQQLPSTTHAPAGTHKAHWLQSQLQAAQARIVQLETELREARAVPGAAAGPVGAAGPDMALSADSLPPVSVASVLDDEVWLAAIKGKRGTGSRHSSRRSSRDMVLPDTEEEAHAKQLSLVMQRQVHDNNRSVSLAEQSRGSSSSPAAPRTSSKAHGTLQEFNPAKRVASSPRLGPRPVMAPSSPAAGDAAAAPEGSPGAPVTEELQEAASAGSSADTDMLQRVQKKIRSLHAAYGLAQHGTDSVLSMIGGLQALLKAYYSAEMLWLLDQPLRVRCDYLGRCFPGSDARVVHGCLQAAGGRVDEAFEMLQQRGMQYIPSAFCMKEVFQGLLRRENVQWIAVWDTCGLMKDHWVGQQLLEEASVFQVVPFMAMLELNRLKDDHEDPGRAQKAQEAVVFVRQALEPGCRGRLRLQPEHGEPADPQAHLPPPVANRRVIGDDYILQCAVHWDHKAMELGKHMVFFTNDENLTARASALDVEVSHARTWLHKHFGKAQQGKSSQHGSPRISRAV